MNGLFTFGQKPTDPGVSSGSGTVAASAAPIATAAAAQAGEDANAALERAPRRGRPRGTTTAAKGDSGLSERALQEKVSAEIARQMDALHDPKAWGALLALPSTVAQVLTKNDARWKLKEEEVDTLGVTGSAAARTMMITNPKALAFFMLGSALLSVYLPRAVQQLEEFGAKKREQAKDEKKA